MHAACSLSSQAGHGGVESSLTDCCSVSHVGNSEIYGALLLTPSLGNVTGSASSVQPQQLWRSGPSSNSHIFSNTQRANGVHLPG